MPQFYNSLSILTNETLTEVSAFLPQLAAALLILLIGSALARAFKSLIVKLLKTLKIAKWVENTPVEHFFKNAEFDQKLESVLGSVIYWLLMLVVIQSAVAALGLNSLMAVLNQVLAYIPQIVSAIIILFFGVLVAGVVESLVKGSIMSIDGHNARVLGKVSSYLVLIIAVLAAINELSIASEFIMILLIGFVTMLSLGLGLALGLGGQDVVKKILETWYERLSREVKKE